MVGRSELRRQGLGACAQLYIRRRNCQDREAPGSKITARRDRWRTGQDGEASGRRRGMQSQRAACSESIKSARVARHADPPETPMPPPS
jgi:hypothetical protein